MIDRRGEDVRRTDPKLRAEGSRREYNAQKRTPNTGSVVPGGWRGAAYGKWRTVEMNRRSRRGWRYQREAQKLLEGDGWLVSRAAQVTRKLQGRWSTLSADFWHVFDLGCRKPGRLLFVQVTHGRTNVSGHKRKIMQLPAPLPGEEWEIWERRLQDEHGRKPPGRAPAFRIKRYDQSTGTWSVVEWRELRARE